MLDPQKILIIRFSSIGDIVLASPLIRVLRSRFPAARIDFLVKAEFADLVRYNHHLSSTIELHGDTFRDLRGLRSTIHRERYDVILDIHNSLRSRYLRIHSGAKRTFVINKRMLRRFALIHWKWNLYNGIVPVAERYLETADALGIENDDKGLEIFIPDETHSAVSSKISKYRPEHFDAVVGVGPSAKHFTKMWLPERFVEVARALAQYHNAKIFLFGGREDTHRCKEITEAVNAAVGHEAAINLGGQLTLLETAAALDFCDVLVCNDTGLMHLAAARQRPVVAIFGPTVREFGFFPYGTEATVIEQTDLTCRPCTHIGSRKCPKGHFLCMKNISSQRVLNAITATLMRQRQPIPQSRPG